MGTLKLLLEELNIDASSSEVNQEKLMALLEPYTEDQTKTLATRDKAKALVAILKRNHSFWGSQPI